MLYRLNGRAVSYKTRVSQRFDKYIYLSLFYSGVYWAIPIWLKRHIDGIVCDMQLHLLGYTYFLKVCVYGSLFFQND